MSTSSCYLGGLLQIPAMPLSLATFFGLLVLLTASAALSQSERTLTVAAAASEQRVALVIGNAAYKDAPLRNPVNDATDMTKKGPGSNYVGSTSTRGLPRGFASRRMPVICSIFA